MQRHSTVDRVYDQLGKPTDRSRRGEFVTKTGLIIGPLAAAILFF